MAIATFDTLKFANRLTKSGFTREQAEAQAEALREIIDEQVATKEDIKGLKTEIAGLFDKLLVRVGGMIGIGVTILAILIKL